MRNYKQFALLQNQHFVLLILFAILFGIPIAKWRRSTKYIYGEAKRASEAFKHEYLRDVRFRRMRPSSKKKPINFENLIRK